MAEFDPFVRRLALFSDNPGGREAALRIARDADARVLVDLALDAAPWPEQLDIVDIVLIETSIGGTKLDDFLPRIAAHLSAAGVPAIVNASLDTLDQVIARLDAPGTTVMADASDADRAAALALAAIPSRPMLHDMGVSDPMRIQRLADEVGRIARTLSDIAGTEPEPVAFADGLIGYRAHPPAAPPAAPSTQAATEAEGIRATIRLRRMRDQYFRGELFADPAWDMMLDLMAARLEGLRVAVSSLCIAAAVPPTTALRWIKTMTDAGIFIRIPDPKDARRIFIDLSAPAVRALESYLDAAKRSGALAI